MLKALPEPVVLTGIGVLACNGLGREAFWDALKNGRSGVGLLDRFDASNLPCQIAGQLWDFDPGDFLNKGDVRRWHRVVHQAIAATDLAINDSNLNGGNYAPERIALGIGTSVGSLDETYDDYKKVYAEGGWEDIDRLASSATSGHASTAAVSAKFGFRGPAITIASGCATGLDILAWGRHQIASGRADVAVVGATEAPLNELTMAGTAALGILSKQNDSPETAMRPFDKNRDGLVLSEACVVVVLERANAAAHRGAPMYGEIAGVGSASEGRNPVVLERDGDAVSRAISAALKDAGMQPEDVDCAHCHGVALPYYDTCETEGYKKALGQHAYRIPVCAPKSMMGQAYATGGLLSIASAAMSLETDIVPPTINLLEPDEDCDLDYVPLTSRLNDMETILTTAMSFGGTHSASLLRRVPTSV